MSVSLLRRATRTLRLREEYRRHGGYVYRRVIERRTGRVVELWASPASGDAPAFQLVGRAS